MPNRRLDGKNETITAGNIAASSAVPSLDTINRSMNCMAVNDMFVTTIGPASLSIYLSDASLSVLIRLPVAGDSVIGEVSIFW